MNKNMNKTAGCSICLHSEEVVKFYLSCPLPIISSPMSTLLSKIRSGFIKNLLGQEIMRLYKYIKSQSRRRHKDSIA